MATTQLLTLTQVSQSAQNNTSRVRILWTTTQTGGSYNNVEKVGYYWVSVNGGAETMYTVHSTLPGQSTKTIVDTTIDGVCTPSTNLIVPVSVVRSPRNLLKSVQNGILQSVA